MQIKKNKLNKSIWELSKVSWLTRGLTIVLLAMTLVSCNRALGTSPGPVHRLTTATTNPTAEFNNLGMTNFDIDADYEEFSMSWTNPVNPGRPIANYYVELIGYYHAYTNAEIASTASRHFVYTGNNERQIMEFTELDSRDYYEFFVIVNYNDNTASSRTRILNGRLVAGTNSDGEGLADDQDTDDDNDGILDISDNCPRTASADLTDTDRDGRGDICDPDDDGDGISDSRTEDGESTPLDNCPLTANRDQADLDGDGAGDACDPDIDGDRIGNANDNCPLIFTSDLTDTDGDGYGDACDIDDDGDGLIEIYNATAFNAMRYNLYGTSFKLLDNFQYRDGDSAGCGGGNTTNGRIITSCDGYELMVDIDLAAAGYTNWTPIGGCSTRASCTDDNGDDPFYAAFNGNGKSINNLNIETTDFVSAIGLFGEVYDGDFVGNVTLTNVNILAPRSSYVGSLVGYASGVTIQSVSVMANQISGGGDNVGGLVGYVEDAYIVASSSIVDQIKGRNNVGGLIGGFSNSRRFDEVITSSSIVNQISGRNSVGGLVGNGADVAIAASSSVVNQISGMNSVGGLVGDGADAVIVASSSIFNELIGNYYVAGLVGDGIDAAIRGSYTVSNSISGSDNVGGISGIFLGSNSGITNSYNNTLEFVNDAPDFRSRIILSGQTRTALKHNSFGGGGIFSMNWPLYECDPTTGAYNYDSGLTNFQQAWDLGDDTQYPALTCLPISLEMQRAAMGAVLSGTDPAPTNN